MKLRSPIAENSTRFQAPIKKTAFQGFKTGLRHFARKVEEMVAKLWSLIGIAFCKHARLRCFGAFSSGGGFGTLHLNKKIEKPSKHGSGFAVLCLFRRSLAK